MPEIQSDIATHCGFEIVRRWDNSFAVYDYAWWPDDYLDADAEANERWLCGTGGWRAKGWQVVYVGHSLEDAENWIEGIY